MFADKEEVDKLGKAAKDQLLDDMQLCLKFDGLTLKEAEENLYQNENEKEIEELVQKMDKVTIEKE